MFDFEFIIEAFPQILAAIPRTLFLAFGSAAAGWIIGVGIALIRRYKTPVLSQICAVFVSFMRGVPLIILLYIAYYAIPIMLYSYGESIGVTIDVTNIPPMIFAMLTFTLDQAAYSSEIFRSALGAVDEGQMEAAYSIGMTKTQGLLRIVFPQALAVATPNLGGLLVGLVKGTALAYYVGVYEIMATSTILAQPAYAYIEAYLMATIIYEVISFILNKLFRASENKLKKFRAAAAS